MIGRKNRWIAKLRATITTLIADAAQLRGERDEARRQLTIAETRLRNAQNRLDLITARVSQADRERLLGQAPFGWPDEVIDAAGDVLRTTPMHVGGAEPWRAFAVLMLNAAARAMHQTTTDQEK